MSVETTGKRVTLREDGTRKIPNTRKCRSKITEKALAQYVLDMIKKNGVVP